MKTQSPHVVAPTLDAFFALMLRSGERAGTVKEKRYNAVAEGSTLDDTRSANREALPSRSRVVLRAFMALILGIRYRTRHTDHQRMQRSLLPMGAAFAVRYASR